MEFLDQFLAMLGSIAAVLGVVVSYLQYKAGRERHHGPSPQANPAMSPVVPASPRFLTTPPGSVRLACVWVVVDALVVVGVLLALFFAIVDNLGWFGLTVSGVPEPALLLAPVVLAALVGLVKVPGAIRHSTGLRRGEAQMRSKLLGSAAIDLFIGVVLVVVVLSLDGMVPDEVFSTLSLYIGYRIISGLIDIALLVHRDTRTWVERVAQPTGRSH